MWSSFAYQTKWKSILLKICMAYRQSWNKLLTWDKYFRVNFYRKIVNSIFNRLHNFYVEIYKYCKKNYRKNYEIVLRKIWEWRSDRICMCWI